MSHEIADFPQELFTGLTDNRERLDDEIPVNAEDWRRLVVELRATQKEVTTIAGLASANWLDAVKSRFDPDPALPVAPLDGDRYLSLGTLNGWIVDNIYEFSVASGLWNETIPPEGTAIHVDDENKIYIFQDGTWKKVGQTISHASLLDLGNDDHLQYVHKDLARTITAKHTFAPGSAQAPFDLGANAQGELVTGLNADLLDGQHASEFEVSGALAAHLIAFDHNDIHTKGEDLGLDAGGANPVTALTITDHIGSSANPHTVTKAQVGLSNVSDSAQLKIASNLSDLDNPVTALGNLGAASTTHKNTHRSGGADAFVSTDLLEAVVKRVQVDGPVILTIGVVADGEVLKRVGTTLIGELIPPITLFSATVGTGGVYSSVADFIVAADASGANRYELHLLGNTVIISSDVIFKRKTDWYGVGNDSPSEMTLLSLFTGRIILDQAGVPPTSLHRFYNLNIAKTAKEGQITIKDGQGAVEFHNCHVRAVGPITAPIIPLVLFDGVSQETNATPSVKMFNCGLETNANTKYLVGTSAAGVGHKVRVQYDNCYELAGTPASARLLQLKGTTSGPVCDLFITGGTPFAIFGVEGQVSPTPTLNLYVDSISTIGEANLLLDLGGTTNVIRYGASRIRETGGPTQMLIGAIADGEFLKRAGGTIIGGALGALSLLDSLAHSATTGQGTDDHHAKLHSGDHVNGTDDIQSATAGQKGLMTTAFAGKMDGIATGADVTGDNPPQAHSLGGSEHNADTLANLNAKVSDAALDDAGDGRIPKDWLSVESSGLATTTLATFQDKVTLSTGALTGVYRFFAIALLDNGGSVGEMRLWNDTDSVQIGGLNIFSGALSGERYASVIVGEVTLAGVTKDMILQWRDQASGNTQGIRNARIEMQRIS